VTIGEHACWEINNLSHHPFPQYLPHEYHSLDGNGGAPTLEEIFNCALKVRVEVCLALYNLNESFQIDLNVALHYQFKIYYGGKKCNFSSCSSLNSSSPSHSGIFSFGFPLHLLVVSLSPAIPMSRERGKPKRGPTYYNFFSQHRYLGPSSAQIPSPISNV
jgi:hypothetical protein